MVFLNCVVFRTLLRFCRNRYNHHPTSARTISETRPSAIPAFDPPLSPVLPGAVWGMEGVEVGEAEETGVLESGVVAAEVELELELEVAGADVESVDAVEEDVVEVDVDEVELVF